MVFPTAPACPFCGAEYKLHPMELKAREDIRLEKISDEQKRELEKAKKQQRMEVGQCRTMEDLLKIRQERGYKMGWVFKMAKLKGISTKQGAVL